MRAEFSITFILGFPKNQAIENELTVIGMTRSIRLLKELFNRFSIPFSSYNSAVSVSTINNCRRKRQLSDYKNSHELAYLVR